MRWSTKKIKNIFNIYDKNAAVQNSSFCVFLSFSSLSMRICDLKSYHEQFYNAWNRIAPRNSKKKCQTKKLWILHRGIFIIDVENIFYFFRTPRHHGERGRTKLSLSVSVFNNKSNKKCSTEIRDAEHPTEFGTLKSVPGRSIRVSGTDICAGCA